MSDRSRLEPAASEALVTGAVGRSPGVERPPLFGGLVAVLTLAFLGLGCASSPRPDALESVLPASREVLETAPPAARDALAEGLRWIAADAPLTDVEQGSAGDSDEAGGS